MKRIRDIFSGNEGFTLIELLIVIVILGVLAAIAVPNLTGLTDSANEEVVKANLRTLVTEIEASRAQNNDFNLDNYNAWSELENMENIDINNNGEDTYSGYEIVAEETNDEFSYTLSPSNGITSGGTVTDN